jgi:hypothetical protein
LIFQILKKSRSDYKLQATANIISRLGAAAHSLAILLQGLVGIPMKIKRDAVIFITSYLYRDNLFILTCYGLT